MSMANLEHQTGIEGLGFLDLLATYKYLYETFAKSNTLIGASVKYKYFLGTLFEFKYCQIQEFNLNICQIQLFT